MKPCLLKTAKLVLGDASVAKLKQISLSNNTIQRRILDMSKDVKKQMVLKIKSLRGTLRPSLLSFQS